MKADLAIAGAGRVAQALGRLLRERGETVAAVASRNPVHARAAAAFIGGAEAVAYAELPRRAGRILIAVPDDALGEVAALPREAQFVAATSRAAWKSISLPRSRGPRPELPYKKKIPALNVVEKVVFIHLPSLSVKRVKGRGRFEWRRAP